jgi:hypothetical protein
VKITITAPSRFLLHPMKLNDDPNDNQGYTLRFENGKSYDVPTEVGQFLVAHGWAETAAKGVKLEEPFDTRNATDEDAEWWENEVLRPARETAAAEAAPADLDVQDAHSAQGADF